MTVRTPDTNISNWRQWPQSQWAYQHLREILPTASVSSKNDRDGLPHTKNLDISAIELPGMDGAWGIKNLHSAGYTDSMVICHNGDIVHRWNAPNSNCENPHIVFSVSKSITACVAGILGHKGLLDVNAPVAEYLPEVKNSAYESCSVQHVLDMTVALDFDENYDEPVGDYLTYRLASGWNAVDQNNPGMNLGEYLVNIPGLREPHGDVFRYRSPNSDLLGMILQAASGQSFPDLLAALLWKPMGQNGESYITVDRAGLGRSAGGICVTIDDLARLGNMIANNGKSNEQQIISHEWIEDTLHNGNSKAWARGDMSTVLPGGRYRNKWYQTANTDNSIWAMGIHGQYLYINMARNVVIARTASQPQPVNDPVESAIIKSFELIAREISP